MTNILFRIILNNMILFIAAGIFSYKCIAKKKILEKLGKQEDLVLKIVVFFAIVFLTVKFVVPTILDIPYCIRGDYFIIKGTAQHNDFGKGFEREVRVLDEENLVIVQVVFPYKPGIEKGDRIQVQYVPHSGYGILLEINGEKVHEMERLHIKSVRLLD